MAKIVALYQKHATPPGASPNYLAAILSLASAAALQRGFASPEARQQREISPISKGV